MTTGGKRGIFSFSELLLGLINILGFICLLVGLFVTVPLTHGRNCLCLPKTSYSQVSLQISYNRFMKKLVLIDGNAIIHRAFHALPPLTTQDGVPTNAVYGFFTMLLKIVEDLRPEYLVVCFDKAAPTFRKQMYVGYQATRPKISDDLSPQFEMIHKALDSAKIKHFEVDGYEADDLIGTISKEAKAKDLQTIIVSGDRDLLQLVNSKVLMLAPIVGMTKMTLFDETKVKEKYGLEPWQIVDYKGFGGGCFG